MISTWESGGASAFDWPARLSLVPNMVSRDELQSAVAFNSASFNAARLVGPGVAGAVAGVGLQPGLAWGVSAGAGLHTGECEVIENDIGGLAIHIAARVMGEAQPREVLVSGTVRDLVVGSGLKFEERGEHELREITDRWRLWAVAR